MKYPIECPVENCTERLESWEEAHQHLMDHHHMEYNQAKNVLWHQESEVTKAQLVEEMENLLDELPEEDTKEILEDITDDHSKTVQEWTQ